MNASDTNVQRSAIEQRLMQAVEDLLKLGLDTSTDWLERPELQDVR